ncbi:hypothetical protein LINGRAHAP2_LOCUS1695, partial [Linum grandiflorum]
SHQFEFCKSTNDFLFLVSFPTTINDGRRTTSGAFQSRFWNLSSLSAFVPSRFQASRPTQDLQSVPLASY